MSADACPTCTDWERLEGFVCDLRRCRVCGTEVFYFDIDRGPKWSITVPAECARRARSGDVEAMLPWLLHVEFTPPQNEPRPFGELCAAYHPDLDRWAVAFAVAEQPAPGWVLGQFRAGVAVLQREAAARAGYPEVSFAVSADPPPDSGAIHRASVAPFDGRLYVAPRDRLYVWARGERPRELWRGHGIPTPFGGPWWGLIEPKGQPLFRVCGNRLHRSGEPPHEGSRPSGARHGAVTVVHWAVPGGDPPTGRADVLTDDGTLIRSFSSRRGVVRHHQGGWLSLDEVDEHGAFAPVSFRDASWALVWRCPDRRAEDDAETRFVAVDADTIETLNPTGGLVERRSPKDGAMVGDSERHVEGAVLAGGVCRNDAHQVWCDGPEGRVWALQAKVEWTGSERRFLAVGADEVRVFDALTGARSEALPRPDPSARVFGSPGHGGMFVTTGSRAAFVRADGATGPWRELPFDVHPAAGFPDGRVVFGCAHRKARAVVGRQDGDEWRVEGVVDDARMAQGPQRRYHWLSPVRVGPVFLGEIRWHAAGWPDASPGG